MGDRSAQGTYQRMSGSGIMAGFINVIGWLAAFASTASFAPQAWRIIHTRDVKGISLAMYALTVSAFALWLTYGILLSDWALVVPNALCLAMATFIFMMTAMSRSQRTEVADAIERKAGAIIPEAESHSPWA